MSDSVRETEGETVIFSRGGGSGGRHAADDPHATGDSRRSESAREAAAARRSGRHSVEPDSGEGGSPIDDVTDDLTAPRRSSPGRPAVNRTAPRGNPGRRPEAAQARQTEGGIDVSALAGPYDVAEAPSGHVRVDLGSLQIPSIEGVEVRVQANAEGVIQQVVLGYGASALQLGVFAAPRSEGIWDEVRAEIRKSLFDDGVAVEEISGEYGRELRARVRSPEGLMDIRFIGVDGPRWMLRAVYQGEAAADPSAAGPLAICLRGLVVDRGRDAMPVREALPLRLPREIAEAAQAQADAQAAQDQPQAVTATQDQAPSDGAGPIAAPGGTTYGGQLNGAQLNGSPLRTGSAPGYPSSGYSSNGSSLNGDGLYGDSSNGGAYGAPVDDASTNGSAPHGTRPASSEAEPRRRPSPRPRRSES